KDFRVSSKDQGRIVLLQFGGIYENSKVWLNGVLLGQRGYGYSSFEYDLTHHLNYGANNTIVVRAENLNQHNSRWYSGSGIYRHVWLTMVDPLHVGQWGTYITTPKVDADAAQVRVRTQLKNDGDMEKTLVLETSILDGSKHHVVTVTTEEKIA